MQLLFSSFGIFGIMLFQDGVYPPVIVSVAVFALAALYLIRLYRRRRVGPLTIILFLAYALPFIHIVPYIWFDFESPPPPVMWGLAVNPYMTDRTIIELMSMIGAVGAAGLVIGASFARVRLSVISLPDREIACRKSSARTLSVPVFLGWVAAAIILSWIAAPKDTVFVAPYTQSSAINQSWNFSSAWMFSYAFLAFALADSMFEISPSIRRLKRKLVLCSVTFIAIWFQLLRGDREILPFIIAAILMYYVWGKGLAASARHKLKLNRPVAVLLVFVVFACAYIVGVVRHSLVGIDSVSSFARVLRYFAAVGAIRVDSLISGTWSGALLTPLSIAGDYVKGALPLKLGQTYLDLFGSIIPGFMADWIGYIRPIDSLHGPAWQMTYGMGGTHAVVVPFMDFRMTGVFLVVGLWSAVLVKMERRATSYPSVSGLAFLGILATATPHWLWYGEKVVINALIIWFIISIFYRFRWMRHPEESPNLTHQLAGTFL